jgi:hypothetical protein
MRVRFRVLLARAVLAGVMMAFRFLSPAAPRPFDRL